MPRLPSRCPCLPPVVAALLAMLLVMLPLSAPVQANTLNLGVSEDLEASGLARHLAPRYGLRANTRVTVIAADAAGLEAGLHAGEIDVVIASDAVLAALQADGVVRRRAAAFRTDEEDARGYAVSRPVDGPNEDRAAAFQDWLTGTVGRSAIEVFEGEVAYVPGALVVERAAADLVPDGDVEAGADLALSHCGRCHRIDARNRFGGMSNTPSFAVLRAQDVWLDKFITFWALNPHPSFTQIDGLTQPFDPERPPSIHPLYLTMDEVDAIVAFAATIEPIAGT